MNTPKRDNIKCVTVPFDKLSEDVKSRLLLSTSRSAELVDVIRELEKARRPHALHIKSLEAELARTSKALDAAMMLVAYYRDGVR